MSPIRKYTTYLHEIFDVKEKFRKRAIGFFNGYRKYILVKTKRGFILYSFEHPFHESDKDKMKNFEKDLIKRGKNFLKSRILDQISYWAEV